MEFRGIPLGFGFQLALDPDAMRNFAILPEEQKNHVIQRAKAASDKTAMQHLVSELANGKLTS